MGKVVPRLAENRVTTPCNALAPLRRLSKMGSSDVTGNAEQFTQFIVKELPYWESLVKRSGATVD